MSDDIEVDRAAVLRTFVGEGEELLAAMEAELLTLEGDAHDGRGLGELLRLAHTIKGNASLFGFDDVVAVAHTVETRLQATALPVAAPELSRLLVAFDELRAAFRAAARAEDEEAAIENDATIRVGLARLDRMLEMIGEVLVARARGDWEALERPVRGVEDAGAMQHLVGVRARLDVQLEAGRLPEGVLLVRPDLRVDVECAEEREAAAGDGAAREIEVERHLASAAQVDAAGDVEEARQLREPVAVRLGRDRGELVPEILREHLRASAVASCTRRRTSRTRSDC